MAGELVIIELILGSAGDQPANFSQDQSNCTQKQLLIALKMLWIQASGSCGQTARKYFSTRRYERLCYTHTEDLKDYFPNFKKRIGGIKMVLAVYSNWPPIISLEEQWKEIALREDGLFKIIQQESSQQE